MGKLTTICRAALPVALLFAGLGSLQAKNYTLPNGNSKELLNVPEGFTSLKVYVKNNASSAINIKWSILSNTVSDIQGWDVSFCDLENCYIQIPGSGSNSLATGSEVPFSVDVTPNGKTGSGKIGVRVYEEGFQEEADTLWFAFNTTVGINEASAIASKIEMYPVPAVQNLQLKLDGTNFAPVQGSIINATGQVVESLRFNNGAGNINIDVNELPAGSYILRLTDRNGMAVSRRFQKS